MKYPTPRCGGSSRIVLVFVGLGLLALVVLFTLYEEEETILETTPPPLPDEESHNIPRGDAARRKILQILASQGLQKLQNDHAFDLLTHNDITQSQLTEMYQNGFVRKWKNDAKGCGVFASKITNRWNIVLLGGSTSAWASRDCYHNASLSQADPQEGRFSNIVEHKMHQMGWNVTIQNMAQGSTTSVWSGIMMDQLINVSASSSEPIDLLIWEHAINDHAPSISTGAPHEMLRFWLTRVQNLFEVRHGRKPPPILIVYLWKFNIGLQKNEKIIGHTIGYRGPDYMKSLEVIDEFVARPHNLQIQVLNLAQLMSPEAFVGFHSEYIEPNTGVVVRREFLDDRHHPGCVASHLIADLIQYTLYTQLVLNGQNEQDNPQRICPEQHDKKKKKKRLPFESESDEDEDEEDNNNHKNLNPLMNPKTIICAFTQWEPRLHNMPSTLPVTPTTLQQANTKYLYNIFPDAVMPGREDRKFGYQIPLCSSSRSSGLSGLTIANSQGDNNPPPSDVVGQLRLTLEGTTTAPWQYLMVVFAGKGIVLTIQNKNHAVTNLQLRNNNNGLPINAGDGSTATAAAVASLPDVVNIPRGAQNWIDLTPFDYDNSGRGRVDNNNNIELSFCDNSTVAQRTNSRTGKIQHAWIHLLVGVATP